MVLVDVNDIIIIDTSKAFIQQLITKLNLSFSLKDLGRLEYFLGIEVHPLPNGSLLLSKSKYVKDLLNKTKMVSAKSIASPTSFKSIVGTL